MYMGHKDIAATPFGKNIPGGFMMTALIHSVMTGEWISILGNSWFFIAFFCILGLIVAVMLRGKTFWAVFVLLPPLLAITGIFSFSMCSRGRER